MAAGAAVKGVGGKKGRSGRKSRAEELGLTVLLDRCWRIEERERVIKALNQKALEGNEKAAALLLAYAYGKPTERIEHSNPDGTPIMSPIAEALTRVYSATTTPAD